MIAKKLVSTTICIVILLLTSKSVPLSRCFGTAANLMMGGNNFDKPLPSPRESVKICKTLRDPNYDKAGLLVSLFIVMLPLFNFLTSSP